MMKRIVSIFLAMLMLLVSVSALADTVWTSLVWTCPQCGQTGNTGKYCPECGAPMPEISTPTDQQQPTQQQQSPLEPTAEPVQEVPYHAGDHVAFGSYYQQNKNSSDMDPIIWIVMDVQDGKLFLISQYGLEKMAFHTRSDGSTWYESAVRDWLNNAFLRTAFSYEEQEAIQLTDVDLSASQGDSGWNSAGRAGRDSQDKVYLLSYREAKEYLRDMKSLLCIPTGYALSQGCFSRSSGLLGGESTSWYWLRNSAFKNNAGVVDYNGDFATCYIHHPYGVVRPVLWVDAKAVTPAD